MENILKQIRSLDLKKITQPELEEMLPTFGMNGENSHEMPAHLSEHFNQGIRFWQYPNQFSKYLLQLAKYDIKSYLEIGCRWGGTFIITSEILKAKHPDLRMYTCDLMKRSSILSWYASQADYTYFNQSSFTLTKDDIQDQVDLILIDGDHSYEGVKRDFEVCLQFKPKYVVFHDISSVACEGVRRFWSEIKNDYKFHEFTDQYESVNGSYLGIGLIEIKQK